VEHAHPHIDWANREFEVTRQTALRALLELLTEDDEYDCATVTVEGEPYLRIRGPRVPEVAVQVDETDFRTDISHTVTDRRTGVTATYLS